MKMEIRLRNVLLIVYYQIVIIINTVVVDINSIRKSALFINKSSIDDIFSGFILQQYKHQITNNLYPTKFLKSYEKNKLQMTSNPYWWTVGFYPGSHFVLSFLLYFCNNNY